MKQKAITKILAILCITVFLFGCTNKKGKAKEATNPADTTKPASNDTAVTTTSGVKLVCNDLGEDSLGTPRFDVMLSVDGKETKIKTINACKDIAKTEYKTYEIPDDAISACGGWWAGAGDYYYITMKDGKPLVFEGWQDESQKEKGYHWKEKTVK